MVAALDRQAASTGKVSFTRSLKKMKTGGRRFRMRKRALRPIAEGGKPVEGSCNRLQEERASQVVAASRLYKTAGSPSPSWQFDCMKQIAAPASSIFLIVDS